MSPVNNEKTPPCGLMTLSRKTHCRPRKNQSLMTFLNGHVRYRAKALVDVVHPDRISGIKLGGDTTAS
jgi:hypothetical protein